MSTSKSDELSFLNSEFDEESSSDSETQVSREMDTRKSRMSVEDDDVEVLKSDKLQGFGSSSTKRSTTTTNPPKHISVPSREGKSYNVYLTKALVEDEMEGVESVDIYYYSEEDGGEYILLSSDGDYLKLSECEYGANISPGSFLKHFDCQEDDTVRWKYCGKMKDEDTGEVNENMYVFRKN